MGEETRASVVRGKVKFYNRDKSQVPAVITAAGGSYSDAKSRLEAAFPGRPGFISSASDIKLSEWLW